MTNKINLSTLDALAKVHASSYASPHHITFSVEGLRNLIEELNKEEPVTVDVEGNK